MTTVQPVSGPSEFRMRDRPAAYALLEATVRAHALRGGRNRFGRLFGIRALEGDDRAWMTGAIGEQHIARILSRLPEEWTVFHSLPVGNGDSDIDHVVVGPGGIFTLNTKRHAGQRLNVTGETVWIAYSRKPYVRNAEYEADRLARLLAGRGVSRPVVHPMIVIDGAESVTVKTAPKTVTVLESSQLLRWFVRRPRTLEASDIVDMVAVLDRADTWRATGPIDFRVVARYEEIVREDSRARRNRMLWVTAGGLAGLAVAALILLPQVAGVL